jgi:hypothetical protein
MGDEEPEFLAYVDQLGLRPNACLTVTERAPYEGPLMVAVGEQLHALGDAVAREIWVEKLPHGCQCWRSQVQRASCPDNPGPDLDGDR